LDKTDVADRHLGLRQARTPSRRLRASIIASAWGDWSDGVIAAAEVKCRQLSHQFLWVRACKIIPPQNINKGHIRKVNSIPNPDPTGA
jgi:hypothetical protein